MKKLALVPLTVLAFAAACSDTSDGPTGLAPGNPYKDDVSNNLDLTVDAASETMELTAGGTTGTTTLRVLPTNFDGKNGCNLIGGTSLVVAVSSSNTSVATVSPGSVTFSPGSGPNCATTATLTVMPVGQGSATISLSQTSNTTGATFNLAPATFTVNVAAAPITNTPPSVSLSGVTHGTSYAKGSVPTALCSVADAEDGPSSFPATLGAITGTYASDGIGSQTATCNHVDSSGLAADLASATYQIIDPSAPAIGPTLSPASPDGNNGWYKSNVSLTWNVSEPESPSSLNETGCVDQNVTADQAEAAYSCSATSAGGSTGPVEVQIKRDATAPSVALSGGPANGSTYYVNFNVPAVPTCSASDALSGLASCNVTGYSNAVGTHTVTATATDDAGNTGTATATYTVSTWTRSGFYSPVTTGALNTVKAGSTVPLKFEVFAGSTELTDPSTTVATFKAQSVACGTLAALNADDVDFTTTERAGLRYDSVGGQFIYNWQTSKTAGCFAVTLTTKDGQSISASFQTR